MRVLPIGCPRFYTGRGKHAKKIFFVKPYTQNKFCKNSPQDHRERAVFGFNKESMKHEQTLLLPSWFPGFLIQYTNTSTAACCADFTTTPIS
jgi:hypothetical protein